MLMKTLQLGIKLYLQGFTTVVFFLKDRRIKPLPVQLHVYICIASQKYLLPVHVFTEKRSTILDLHFNRSEQIWLFSAAVAIRRVSPSCFLEALNLACWRSSDT